MIIERYLIKEIVQTFLGVIAVLLLVFLGIKLVSYLAEAAMGKLPGDLVFKILIIFTIRSLSVLLSVAFYLAVLLTIGRLYKDNEMTAMFASGIGIYHIMRIVFFMASMAAIVIAVLSLYVAPWVAEQGIQMREQAAARSALLGLVAGQFKEFGSNGDVYYIERLSEDGQMMHNIFIRLSRAGTDSDIFSARSGYQYADPATGDRFLVLVDGYRYEGVPNGPGFKIHKYQKSAVRIEQREVIPQSRGRYARSSYYLFNSAYPADHAELHWRIAIPISTVLLALLAVLLGHTTPRQGKYAKLLGALLIYIIYFNLTGVGRILIKNGMVVNWMGMWWLHGLFVLLIIVLFVKQFGVKGLLVR